MQADDCATFDYVLVMDQQNLRDMQSLDKTGCADVALFISYAYRAGLVDTDEVADPWYSGLYDLTYERVLIGSQAFLAWLRDKHAF